MEVVLSRLSEAKVVLLPASDKTLAGIAAHVCRSPASIEDDLGYGDVGGRLTQRVMGAGHTSVAEFDWFVFGVEGYPRVTEIQLVRSRIASYAITSGRIAKNRIRFVIPDELQYSDVCDEIASSVRSYAKRIEDGMLPEKAREFLPQCISFKGMVGMNARALKHFFELRCCNRAQGEIRNLANSMLALCKKAKPDLFKGMGAFCVANGYCNQGRGRCQKVNVPTLEDLKERWNGVLQPDRKS